MVKVQWGWYLINNTDGFMKALGDFWDRELTEEENRDLIRPIPEAFPMMIYMRLGDELTSYPILQGVSIEQLRNGLQLLDDSN